MVVLEGQIRADHLDIELHQAPPVLGESHKLKLYKMLTLAKKI